MSTQSYDGCVAPSNTPYTLDMDRPGWTKSELVGVDLEPGEVVEAVEHVLQRPLTSAETVALLTAWGGDGPTFESPTSGGPITFTIEREW